MKGICRVFLKISRNYLSAQQGMTLVESLVALAILSVSVTAYILALSTGSIAARTQEEDALAQGLARSQMETVKAAAYDATGATYTPVSAPAGYSITVGADSSLYSDNSIQKVTVTVSRTGTAVFILEGYKVDR
jgi:prepilin-type N-terminal cleavage/methylation domain-containing protein